ncbi:putative membrane protein [Rubricella aquisinus]|uniref:Putative membrane protein n=1 Tax=Rubricella aquisinus TaxID=2028108 RepID=A0A840WZW0_9RHOB|nr:DUF599 domain-containing protein [Rubricella aquisinus]MBB5515186.1 putative membrane protein [Rubricella aquisinus]
MNELTGMSLTVFSMLDILAICIFCIGWAAIGLRVEHPSSARKSTHQLMDEYREHWMMEMARRDVRIFDAQIINGLRQATAFFGSTTMLAIGGGAALLAQAETLNMLAGDISPELAQPRVLVEAKLLVLVLALTVAFMRFVWANRLFGYAATVMAAVPAHDEPDAAQKMAKRAAKVANYAARSFNRGLRAIYFALASLAWLLGPVPLIVSTFVTVAVIWRREFHSMSRNALLED